MREKVYEGERTRERRAEAKTKMEEGEKDGKRRGNVRDGMRCYGVYFGKKELLGRCLKAKHHLHIILLHIIIHSFHFPCLNGSAAFSRGPLGFSILHSSSGRPDALHSRLLIIGQFLTRLQNAKCKPKPKGKPKRNLTLVVVKHRRSPFHNNTIIRNTRRPSLFATTTLAGLPHGTWPHRLPSRALQSVAPHFAVPSLVPGFFSPSAN